MLTRRPPTWSRTRRLPALGAVGDEAEERPPAEAAADHEPVAEGQTADEPSVHDIGPPDNEQAEESGIAAVYAEAFDFVPRDRAEGDSAAALAARLRQDARRHSMFGEFVKIILGGIAGLVIGYYLLNYFGGERFDRLRVYLPGCPHTYQHWPFGEGGEVGDAP